MSLTDAVSHLSDYLNQSISTGNKSFQASANRAPATPDGQLKAQLQDQTSQNTLNSLNQNPIINTALDTANQIATSVSQQLVRNVISKVNLTPIQNATQQFFTLFASVTSFGTEVAMQFARNTGNNMIAALKQKDATSTALEAEITALYNACAILLNGQPFFQQYLQNVISALLLIQNADKNLKNVVLQLSNPTTPRYQARKFTLAVTQLTSARDLILPDRGVDVTSIRSTTSFVAATLNRQSNQQVYAAAISIPGITVQIGKLILNYELQSVAVNAYINTFINALDDYIANYEQSPSVNQATIDHLNAGISQVDNLLAQMNTVLSTNTGSSTDVKFRTQLSAYGIQWGVQLTAIIEWLKLNPGAGSALLTQTSLSVEAYKRAIAQIQAQGDIKFNGGTVFITAGQEDAFKGLVTITARLLVTANTLVANSTSTNNVRSQATACKTYLQRARQADAGLVSAITPFLNTKTTLSGPVAAGVNSLVNFANKMGLDRMVGLLTNGKVKDLFATTPDTATYAGAAVVGINSVLDTLKALPNATSQQVAQIELLRDDVQKKQKAQEIFTGRQAQATQDADTAQQQAAIQSDKNLVKTATEAAKQLDATVAGDPTEKTQQVIGPQVTPGSMPDSSDVKATLA